MIRRPPIRCRAIVLDMDGVLIDSEDVNVASAFEAFAAVGFPLTPADRAVIVGKHPADYVPWLADRHGVPATALSRILAIQGDAYAATWAARAVLIPGVPETLETLVRRGFRLALATSAGGAHTAAALKRFAIASYFEFALTKDDVERRKPDPEIYIRAVSQLGLPAADVAVVEDSAYGVAAAKGAGLACLAVRTRHTPEELLVAADRRIGSLAELPDHVSRPES